MEEIKEKKSERAIFRCTRSRDNSTISIKLKHFIRTLIRHLKSVIKDFTSISLRTTSVPTNNRDIHSFFLGKLQNPDNTLLTGTHARFCEALQVKERH